MPFSSTKTHTEEQWAGIFEYMFRPAFTELGYNCVRAAPMVGSLSSSIIERLHNARIVLADLTDRNPNVFYELGVRHTLRRGTILVTQAHEHIPSDLAGEWYVRYVPDPPGIARFKDDIKRLVALIEESPNHADNPVAAHLDRQRIAGLSYTQRDTLNKLSALLTELTLNRNILFSSNSSNVEQLRPLSSLRSECLRLLQSTRYIDPGAEALQLAYELDYLLSLLIESPTKALTIMAQARLVAFLKEIRRVRRTIEVGEYSDAQTITYLEWELTSSGVPIYAQGLDAASPASSILISRRDSSREEILRSVTTVARSPVPFDDDEELFDSGCFDSFALADLVQDLEERFKLKIPDADIRPAKFSTVNKIWAYIMTRLEESDS